MDPNVVYTNSVDDASTIGSIWILVIFIILIVVVVALIFWANSGTTNNGNNGSGGGRVGPQGPPGPQGPQGPAGPPGSGAFEDAIYFSGVVSFPANGPGETVVQLGLLPENVYTFNVSITVASGTISPFTFSPSSPNGSVPLRYETFVQGQNMVIRFYGNDTNFTQGILSVIAIPVDHIVLGTTQGITSTNFGTQTFNTLPSVNTYRPGQRINTTRYGRRY